MKFEVARKYLTRQRDGFLSPPPPWLFLAHEAQAHFRETTQIQYNLLAPPPSSIAKFNGYRCWYWKILQIQTLKPEYSHEIIYVYI